MGEIQNEKYNVAKDLKGRPIKLALVKKAEYKDKEYDLYSVCKVVDGEFIPIYDETFTPKQLENFNNNPTYYIAVTKDEEVN